jgi:3-(3-hydroxy-phenyl)propionate hydroxylase
MPPLPVVVVGAGPTGMVVAALLARYGVPVVVLERQPTPYPLPRAVHLDDEAMRVLQAVGVTETFLPLTRPALGLRLVDARLRTMAEFRRSDGPHGYPQASLFDQPALERLLRARLAGLPLVQLRTGTEVSGLEQRADGTVLVGLRDGEQVEAAAVLGCDGAGSTVRELLGIAFEDLGFEERWLVVDARSPVPLGTWDGVHQVCDPRRAGTYLQVGADRYRWEFRLHDGEQAGDLDLPALLRPWGAADVELLRSAEYVFRARLAQRWRDGRVFLLGDAAHQTPPFIGQGLGLGLRDAHNLAWKLAAVLGGGAPEPLLDSYERERAPHAKALTRKAITVGWALTGGQDGAARVRRLALAVLCRVPGVTTRVLDRPTPALRVGRGQLSGTLVPQPRVDGVLLDELLGDGYAVLSDGPPPADAGGHPVLDAPLVRAWLRAAGLRAVLVRPDRVVERSWRA